MAHRGACDVAPSSRCSAVWSTLITAPSISQSIECRCSSQLVRNASTSAIESTPVVVVGTGSPAESAHARNPRCESNSIPSAAPNECTHSRSGREDVTFGSFCRSDPAAAFRGFANGRWPLAVSSSFSPSNAFTGKYISPRTSIRAGGSFSSSFGGTPRTVRTLAVMSSPVTPSPRVAPRTKAPRS